ncbi:hypothetical protein KPATCC21470_2187 [Kitasatospora purpeofusca]
MYHRPMIRTDRPHFRTPTAGPTGHPETAPGRHTGSPGSSPGRCGRRAPSAGRKVGTRPPWQAITNMSLSIITSDPSLQRGVVTIDGR